MGGHQNETYSHSRWGGRSNTSSPVRNNKQEDIKIEKIFLFVSFNNKDDAKNMGAEWCKNEKKWFTYSDNIELIKKYGKEIKKIYIDVPFKYKNIAKSNGAMWDINNKKWYIENKEKSELILNYIKDYDEM